MAQRIEDGEFEVGRRGAYSYQHRGTTLFGIGDIVKVNRKSVMIIDRKYPGEERITVDKGLFYKVFDL